jgi:hypothetical protein
MSAALLLFFAVLNAPWLVLVALGLIVILGRR